jgi:hypothetical protein
MNIIKNNKTAKPTGIPIAAPLARSSILNLTIIYNIE